MTRPSDNRVPLVAANALRRRVVLVSLILVVGLGFVLAHLATAVWGAWSWILAILYCSIL